MLKSLIKILNLNSKNSSMQEKNTKRKCSKCGEEKPLDKDHYQVVKSFKSGFSYYCNSCDKPPRKEK
jgi:late competence protein required for DNA uptake (superfamily II DNA/RNA helicase)